MSSTNAAIEASWVIAKASTSVTEREAGWAAYRAAKVSLAAEAATASAVVPTINEKGNTVTTTTVSDIAEILANPELATAIAAAIRAMAGTAVPPAAAAAAAAVDKVRIPWAKDGSDDILRTWLTLMGEPEYKVAMAFPAEHEGKSQLVTKFAKRLKNRPESLLTTGELRVLRQKQIWITLAQRKIIDANMERICK